mgnify:FL=1|tara:strand:+ start:6811 stop:7515 length:705 start_codon:yes stop_codon:yes gene_type:complete
MTQYAGNDAGFVTGQIDGRYFYGLRRTEQGELFFTKVDQMDPNAVVQVNEPGDPANNFNEFEQGVDFFEGRDQNHEIVYSNLKYEQMRWDDRHVNYYINDAGEFVMRLNKPYTYPTDISSDGVTSYNPNFYQVTASGGKFYLNGIERPTINLYEGQTYTFGQSDSSNNTHPLRLSTTKNGTHGGGVEYTDGVTVFGQPGIEGSYVKFKVPVNAPTLYYYCTNHSGMGGQINTLT